MLRDRQRAAVLHIGGGPAEGGGRAAALGRGRHEQRRVGERQFTLRQADARHQLVARRRHLHRPVIGESDVLAGEDRDPAGDEPRILAGLEHEREPVHGRVRVAAAHRLDECAGGVVVGVAEAVVEDGLPLNRLLADVAGDVDRPRRPAARGRRSRARSGHAARRRRCWWRGSRGRRRRPSGSSVPSPRSSSSTARTSSARISASVSGSN